MHMAIAFLVDGEDVDDAVANAENYFNDHLHYENSAHSFDYCKPMESGLDVAGSDRWTQYVGDPLAIDATTHRAEEIISDRFLVTREWFAHQLAETLVNLAHRMPSAFSAIEQNQNVGLLEIDGDTADHSYAKRLLPRREISDRWVENFEAEGEEILELIPSREIDAMMAERFDYARSTIGNLDHDVAYYCYLHDATRYESAPNFIDNLEDYEEMMDEEHREGKWIVPLDCHH